eukprot:1158901-Pelagomonas_calceolata.AAC.3
MARTIQDSTALAGMSKADWMREKGTWGCRWPCRQENWQSALLSSTRITHTMTSRDAPMRGSRGGQVGKRRNHMYNDLKGCSNEGKQGGPGEQDDCHSALSNRKARTRAHTVRRFNGRE